jgi:PAS domain S-box-containing protein
MTDSQQHIFSSDEYRSVIATSMEGFLLIDLAGIIRVVNDSYCTLMGYRREELLGQHLSLIEGEQDEAEITRRMKQLQAEGCLRFETRHRRRDGALVDVDVNASYSTPHVAGFIYSFIRDISAQKRTTAVLSARMRLMEYSLSHTLHELLVMTLDEAEELTGSCIGFYHFMDDDSQMLTLQAWSTRTSSTFCTAEGLGKHYPVATAGVWVDCVKERRPVIHNDYASLPHRKGMPQGHAVVVRELAVPVMRLGRVVAILGVGNKATDYDEHDVETIGMLAGLAWELAERKRIEDELKQSEAIMNASQQIANVGGWDWDCRNRKMTWTDQTYRIHDMEPDALAPRSPEHIEKSISCYRPEDRQIIMDAFSRCTSNGEPYDLDFPLTTVSGRNIWIRTVARAVRENGGISRVIGTIQDITNRKSAEELLRLNEERFRNAFEFSAIGMALVSPTGKWLKVNRRVCDITGYTADELMQKTFQDITHPEDLNTDLDFVRRMLVGEIETYQMEKRYFHKAGHIVWVLLVVSLVRDDQGAPLHFISQIQDISATKQAEEERRRLDEQLRETQKMESLGVLAGGIAHDFNNILQVIMGNAELVRLRLPANTPVEKNLNDICQVSSRAAELCQQMLAYAGKAPLIRGSCDMVALVDEMVRMLRATLAQNVVLSHNTSRAIPTITADSNQIRQIVMNLIVNGAEAIGTDQGSVRVTLSKGENSAENPAKDYLGRDIAPGGYVCLAVADTGCGMSDEIRQRLFDPFFTTKFDGRGLGMPAVLGIISSHHGALQLDTVIGRGTTVTVWLPAEADNNATEPKPSHWRGSGTILLVEDEQAVRQLCREMLRELGYSVVEAANGQEALELFRHHRQEITLVITDIGMPVLDGYDLFRELKLLSPQLPIIISSGFGDTTVTERIPRHEIAGIINKPYRLARLREVMKDVSQRRLPD